MSRKSYSVIADRGYDANLRRDWLCEADASACIAPRNDRKLQFEYDLAHNKTRNIVDRMFNRLKDWRQLRSCTFR